MMTADFVSHLLDHLGDTAVMVYLFNWGEPLLNPQIADIVRLIHGRGIFTSVSSNLSVAAYERLEALVDAGLDHLSPSIDGATQEVYEVYRKRGRLDLVYENIRRIVEYRKSARRRNPVIDWQYLDFDHNRHEIAEAERTAYRLGVDRFHTIHGCIPDDQADDRDPYRFRTSKYACELLWRSVVVSADAGVAPCCTLYRKDHDFGNLESETMAEIRNGERYVLARRLFDERNADKLPADLTHPCLLCDVADMKPHLAPHVLRNRQAQEEAERASGIKSAATNDFFYRL